MAANNYSTVPDWIKNYKPYSYNPSSQGNVTVPYPDVTDPANPYDFSQGEDIGIMGMDISLPLLMQSINMQFPRMQLSEYQPLTADTLPEYTSYADAYQSLYGESSTTESPYKESAYTPLNIDPYKDVEYQPGQEYVQTQVGTLPEASTFYGAESLDPGGNETRMFLETMRKELSRSFDEGQENIADVMANRGVLGSGAELVDLQKLQSDQDDYMSRSVNDYLIDLSRRSSELSEREAARRTELGQYNTELEQRQEEYQTGVKQGEGRYSYETALDELLRNQAFETDRAGSRAEYDFQTGVYNADFEQQEREREREAAENLRTFMGNIAQQDAQEANRTSIARTGFLTDELQNLRARQELEARYGSGQEQYDSDIQNYINLLNMITGATTAPGQIVPLSREAVVRSTEPEPEDNWWRRLQDFL